MRWMPAGFIFDANGMSCFPPSSIITTTISVFNSKVGSFLLSLINPTVAIQVGDLARLPFIDTDGNQSERLKQLTQYCVHITYSKSFASETTFDFIAPQNWNAYLRDWTAQQARMAEFEAQIDEEIYRLYNINQEGRRAIETELHSDFAIGSDEENANDNENASGEEYPHTESEFDITREELAIRWISFAIGIILGRFQPGIVGVLGNTIYRREDFAIVSLPLPDEAEFDQLVGAVDRFAYVDANGGRHLFTKKIEDQLRALADKDGIVVLDEGHPDDLPAKVETALELMLGERGAAEVVAALSGDTNYAARSTLELERSALRRFLERDFFAKWHVKWYRKRPIYWLLQSPKKLYGLYFFHERITKDTLFVVQRKYLDGKIRFTQQALAEARTNAEQAASARDRRALNKQADDLEKVLADLDEFGKRLKAITDRGYDPDIDDGVILNLAPLADVIPAWSKEPQKYWAGLEAGDYDWAHLAMKYWPDRVKKKCQTDKSLAIAHGME